MQSDKSALQNDEIRDKVVRRRGEAKDEIVSEIVSHKLSAE